MRLLLIKLNGWPGNFDERVRALANHLDQIDVVRPAVSDTSHKDWPENVNEYCVQPARPTFMPIGLHLFLFPLHVFQAVLLSIYLCKKENIDVIHSIDYILGGLVGAIVSTIYSTPFVVSIRGIQEPRYKDMAKESGGILPRFNYYIVSSIPRFVLPKADHIIAKSEYQLDEYEYLETCSTVVPTGVNFDKFNPRDLSDDLRSEIKNRYEFDDMKSSFLYLGKLIEVKGVKILLNHIDTISGDIAEQCEFIFIGECPTPKLESELEVISQDINADVRLYPNRIPFEEVPELLDITDCLILLSEPKTEGVPRVLQEACAMETPSISSDVEGIKEFFEDNDGCLIIDRNDPDQFESSLQKVFDEDITINRGEYFEYMDINKNYRRYAGVYERVTAEGNKPEVEYES